MADSQRKSEKGLNVVKAKKRKKKSDFRKLKAKAWAVYSSYIRQKNANVDGFAECVTCGDLRHWKRQQAGHFVPGRSANILFAENNVHVQCYRCNIILSGNWDAYFKFMEKEYGLKVIRDLMALKDSPTKSTADFKDECERIISLYGHYKK